MSLPSGSERNSGAAGEEEMRASRAEAERKFQFSSRENSAFKWKVDKSVVGALEVACEPTISIRSKYEQKGVLAFEEEFAECLKLWGELKLRGSFITAAESIPPCTKCCGCATDVDETIKSMVELLNEGWAKSVNKQLKDRGYKVGCYCWSWTNPTGASETNILLIRFHSLVKERS
jgi:hypothetical protein